MHFDFTINVGMLAANGLLAIIAWCAVHVVKYLKTMSFRVNVMWNQFEQEHPDLVRRAIVESRI